MTANAILGGGFRRGWRLLVAGAVWSALTVVIPATPAFAGTCGTLSSDHFGRYHTDSDGTVAAIRAPIKLRRDSSLCDSSSSAFTSNYIALEDDSGDADTGQIRQIGWDDGAYNVPSGKATPYCKFWAVGTGQPHDYACSISDNTYTFFMIKIVPVTGGSDYVGLYDCGEVGGYGSCPLKASGSVPSSTWATVLSETNFPGQIHALGASSNPVNYGTSAYPIEQRNDRDDAWSSGIAVENSLPDQHGITDYLMSWNGTSKILSTWDDRN